jgi:hypothetical protein
MDTTTDFSQPNTFDIPIVRGVELRLEMHGIDHFLDGIRLVLSSKMSRDHATGRAGHAMVAVWVLATSEIYTP